MKTYLLKSSSYYLINEKIKELLGDIETVKISLSDATIEDFINDASYYGLFSTDRGFIIKDTKYFGGKFNYEEESNLLYNFLNNNNSDDIFIFICDDIKKSKDLTKKVLDLGAEIIDIEVNDESFNDIISSYSKENKINITPDAIKLLRENTLDNLDIFMQEIEKLSLISSSITKKIINEYGSINPSDDAFLFSNAVISKDFNNAFFVLDKLLTNGVDVNSLVSLLANSYSNMYMVKDALKYNMSDDEMTKLFGYSSKNRVYVLKKNASFYSLDDLKEIIINLANLDKKIKTGYNPVYGLKEFLLSL